MTSSSASISRTCVDKLVGKHQSSWRRQHLSRTPVDRRLALSSRAHAHKSTRWTSHPVWNVHATNRRFTQGTPSIDVSCKLALHCICHSLNLDRMPHSKSSTKSVKREGLLSALEVLIYARATFSYLPNVCLTDLDKKCDCSVSQQRMYGLSLSFALLSQHKSLSGLMRLTFPGQT
jgi:hypothetical protein